MRRRPITSVPRAVPPGQLRRTLLAVRRFRMNFLFGTLLLLFALQLGRLGQLQLVDAALYRAEAERNTNSAYQLRARRGQILDRNDVPLAIPKPARRIGLDPTQIKDPHTFALVLSDFLGGAVQPWDVRDVIRQAYIWAREHGKALPQYRILLPYVDDPALVDRLDEIGAMGIRRQRRLGLWGAVVHPEEGRHYPNGDYASHVLGQMPRGEGRPGTGVEQAFDADLTGTARKIALHRDARHRGFAIDKEDACADTGGKDVRLSIDITIQHFLEQALSKLCVEFRPTQACGIVLDPHSGEVLALASRPTFDPNHDTANSNLVIQGLYEPGSFFKPFTVAWALRNGVVTPDEILEMPPSVLLQGEKKRIHDVHPVGPGTVLRLIFKSSNTGSAELADRLGTERMRALFEMLYPERRGGTRSGLPYEKCGGPRKKTWPWWLAHRAAFGQGFHITPMQMVSSFAAFARDDARIVTPTLRLRGNVARPAGVRLCNRAHLAVVREGLARCVTEGTASKAFQGAPFTAAAKTATAQQWGRLDGKPCLFNNCSLAAYAPAEQPEVVVLILAQVTDASGGFGGTVAGPYVREVIQRVLSYWRVSDRQAHAKTLTATGSGGTR